MKGDEHVLMSSSFLVHLNRTVNKISAPKGEGKKQTRYLILLAIAIFHAIFSEPRDEKNPHRAARIWKRV